MTLHCSDCGSDLINSCNEEGLPAYRWCESCGGENFMEGPPANPPHVDRALDLTTRDLYSDDDTMRLNVAELRADDEQFEHEREEEALHLRTWAA